MNSTRTMGDPDRDDREEQRQKAEHEYEDALMAANAARIGTLEFEQAMAEVRALREELRLIDAGGYL